MAHFLTTAGIIAWGIVLVWMARDDAKWWVGELRRWGDDD